MPTKPRYVAYTDDLANYERYCTCCERRLTGRFAWLELDQRTNTYHDHGDVPEDQSQGWFPFGLTCARNLLSGSRKEFAA